MAQIALDQDYNFYIGTYSDLDVLAHQPYAPTTGKGIHIATISKDGNVSEAGTTPVLNPAVLIPHPDRSLLYGIVETIKSNGSVVQFNVGEDNTLTEVGTFEASGKSTCYLALSPERDIAIVINYWDAIIDVVEVDADGKLGEVVQSFKQLCRKDGEWRQVEYREDHWENRQVGPHAHCAHFWGNWVFIPDLGENAVFQYKYNKDEKRLVPDTYIKFEPGSGPRHMAMHPTLDICYVSNELFNTVCVAKLDASDPEISKERLIPIQYESTLETRDQVSYVSEIKLSPDARFLYVSNRGDNSLAIFKVLEDGKLERIDVVPTGGKFPRHFALTPCGKAVIVANQDSSNLTLFSRDLETGLITATGQTYELPAPNYIRFA
ncbi:MAG: lactonase family protein [Rhizobiaceae bacterium]|nr:lactonase family protein [Rhizobiaceae bacterium]